MTGSVFKWDFEHDTWKNRTFLVFADDKQYVRILFSNPVSNASGVSHYQLDVFKECLLAGTIKVVRV